MKAIETKYIPSMDEPDILSPRYEGPYKKVPSPKKVRPKKVVGYSVLYGGSLREPYRQSKRVYTKGSAGAIVRRLQRRGIDAYASPLETGRPLKKIVTRRSR